MTEQNKREAELLDKLEELSNDSEVDMYSVATLNAYFEECKNVISGLLEEIQQYRAIGTVEEIQTAMKYMRIVKMHGTIGEAIDACAEYESIGTIEELQALKEKSVAKKPIEWANGTEHCPCCEKDLSSLGYWKHCIDCGQQLDWE